MSESQDQSLIVWLCYETDEIGDLCRDEAALEETYRWSDAIEAALGGSGAGECIVNEYGGGGMKEIYVGPDAEAIWLVIGDVVRELPVREGSWAEVEGRRVWER